MAASRPPRSVSARDISVESAGSWDTLEWTKIEPVTRSVSHVNLEFLLEAERVEGEGHGVVLVNTDEAGTLFVTNFRLLFLSDGTRNIVPLGTIPLATIEKFIKMVAKIQSNSRQTNKSSSRRLLQIIGKDMRIIVFCFRPRTKQRRVIYDALLRCTKPERIWDLYAFTCGPSKFSNPNPKVRLLNEYFRLLGNRYHHASRSMIEDGSFALSNDLWRISDINFNYALCQSYPFALLVPKTISDDGIIQASNFRARSRVPAISWCHPGTGAVLARSSQPLVGLMNTRSNADEKLVDALCALLVDGKDSRRKLYIADARPRKNALANGAMGGGSESSSNYFQSEIVFFGIDNIHAMRESFARFREYLDTHGAASSDGMSSFLRHGGWTWGGGNLSSMSASVSTLGDSGWLIHVQSVLAGSAWIAARVALESAAVLVHCSDGWDRTSQLVALANLMLDPYYRTFTGFQALVEKDWLAFGHPFSDRVGMPSISGSSFELTRHASTGSFSTSPLRQSSGSFSPQASNSSHAQNNYSPIFLQWVDCVSQLLRIYPFAFEFSSTFLVDFLDCVLSCRFGNFLCNSEKERQMCGVDEACGCMWAYLTYMRSSEGRSHTHYNLFYDPLKHNGPLLPPAAALAPMVWPQFHLRWACPFESQARELEAECRNMAMTFSELQKAKEVAEMKAKEYLAAMEILNADLQNEKQVSSSAMNLAKRASKESAAIQRAVESLGCRVNFANSINSIDCTVDGESSPTETSQRSSFPRRESEGTTGRDDKSDLSVSITVVADDVARSSPLGRVCETLCPLRAQGRGCQWPDAACAQLGSQFVGLKANVDAFDRLSIYDHYFQSDEILDM
ncbi:phosphatidylinositol-3-phosphatase myotubularin-1-like isoform X1 [Hibiscus syriacus]|nr:phosphatidylinositol-3-phosphatase myotubularin-1-like isoform X1 [Hibiscus syriacus]